MKDKNNKADYNIWTSGEYNKLSPNIQTRNQKISLTKKHSKIGENSHQIIRTNENNSWTKFPSEYKSTTCTVTINILSPESNGAIRSIIEYSDGTSIYSSVTFYKNNNYQIITASINDNENNKEIKDIGLVLYIYSSNKPVYIDNINLNITS